MNKDLTAYVKIYKVFEPEFCSEVVSSLEQADWHEHQFNIAGTNEFISYDNELSVSHYEAPKKREITERLWGVIKQYLNDMECEEWFNSWSGYTAIRFNKYDVSTQMKIHCDHIHTIFDGERKGVPVLTILGALNDGYEGGELILWQDTEIKIPPGHVAVFPSNFLYPHKVEPVKSGVRHSYVSWVW